MTKDELIEATKLAIIDTALLDDDTTYRIAQAALAVIAPAVLDMALDDVTTDRTIEKHGAHCCCITCELNIAEDGIRALKERFV